MGIEIIGQQKKRNDFNCFLQSVDYQPLTEQKKTTTFNFNPLVEDDIQQLQNNLITIEQDIRQKKDYSYVQDFEQLQNYVLSGEQLQTVDDIKTFCKDYNNINANNNLHLKKWNLFFISNYRDIENNFHTTIEKEKELSETNNPYLIEWGKGDIRKEKRNSINKLNRIIKTYHKQMTIRRKQHYLINVFLREYNNNLYYEFVFNIFNPKLKQTLKHTTLLEFKFNNEKDNSAFAEFMTTTKKLLHHIGKHHKRENRINKKGKTKQIEAFTKKFIRFNRDNRNIKFNAEMIYLFLQHFELIGINENDLSIINKTIKGINRIETTNIFKQKAYIYNSL